MPYADKTRKAEYNRAYYAKNRKNLRAQQRSYYQETERPKKLQEKYGITAKQYDAMLEAQGFKCAICFTDTPRGPGTWHVDHCHTSGRVRGLLCNNCNLGLGYFNDSRRVLSRAIKYLQGS